MKQSISLKLTEDEQVWLDDYRQTLAQEFPNFIEEVVVFGSKARGDAGPDSDLDILVVVRDGNWRKKRAIRHRGHELAVLSEAIPSIMVYTREEWLRRRESGSPFYQAITRDGIKVA